MKKGMVEPLTRGDVVHRMDNDMQACLVIISMKRRPTVYSGSAVKMRGGK